MPKFSIEKLNEIRNSKGYTLKELAEISKDKTCEVEIRVTPGLELLSFVP